MFALTDKISDNVTTRLNPALSSLASARQLVDTRVIPFAVPAGRKAAQQVRVVVAGRLVPAVTTASTNARVASAPARAEALRRSRLAAAALSGGDAAVSKRHRRWPVALAFLVFGAGIGAAAAWLAQAGRPVQLTPYALSDDDDQVPVDLTEEFSAHHTA